MKPGSGFASLAPTSWFKILNIKPLKLALEAKDLTLGLDCCLQRRSFWRQFPPQLEGDFGQAAMGLKRPFRADSVVRFRSCCPEFLCVQIKDLQDFIRSQAHIIERVSHLPVETP